MNPKTWPCSSCYNCSNALCDINIPAVCTLLMFIVSDKTFPLACQVSSVREGMARVVPVPLLSLFTGPELETMVCGSPDIPLDLLKSVVTYKGVDANAPLVRWFWETLESFSNAERSLFLRFVWGRTRLPRTIVDFRGRDFVFQVKCTMPNRFPV